MKQRLIIILTALITTLCLTAQDIVVRRGNCIPEGEAGSASAARSQQPIRRALPTPNTTWDANRTYRQLVILISFSDKDFLSDDPNDYYNKMFNEPGFQQRKGAGSVADYYRDQSGGLLNLQFDVYGPYKVSSKAQPYDNPTISTRNYGRNQMREAAQLFLKDNPDIDFSVYDWDEDNYVNQVIYIAAGYCGNQGSELSYGYIWPNTSSFTNNLSSPDGHIISTYTCSSELWTSNNSCGIGTICHEFSHSLGLPDFYPTDGNAGYSVVDEWDLMDGGNFVNNGSCPPNFTPMEKILLGWLDPVELTEPTTVTNLKPSAEGGEVYQIKHSAKEWLLLENRQLRGWDFGIPGKGLVIYHVYYDEAVWSNNHVNNIKDKRYYELVHADNLDYDAWESLFYERYDAGLVKSRFQASGHLNSLYLSTSSYPWSTDSTDFVNNELTDESVPAAKMNYPNEIGNSMLEKPITNISMSEDGLISFDFMGGVSTAIRDVRHLDAPRPAVYDLFGRQVASRKHHSVYIIRKEDGTIQKVFK
ncbi:MAG: M6 family metalloprotease domain-containing protein [Prevotella sp.]|nr:M6 family metalloprotease domain-containing protein [Prevotella sp.]